MNTAGRITPKSFFLYDKMSLLKYIVTTFLLSVSLCVTGVALANEGGGGGEGGGGANGLLAKVDAITVNLQGPSQKYLQVELTLKLAKPDVSERIKLYMPAIRNNLILLLTSKEPAQLEPLEGKQQLVIESKRVINKALEVKEKEGVTDVLFSSFIIQ
jgi:flagellar FliL protein